jgi:hypothetical protein
LCAHDIPGKLRLWGVILDQVAMGGTPVFRTGHQIVCREWKAARRARSS